MKYLVILILIPGCGVVNFAMNVDQAVRIQNLYDYLYTTYYMAAVERGEEPMNYSAWSLLYDDYNAFADYCHTSLLFPELNSPPMKYDDWFAAAKPKAKKPKPKRNEQ